MVDGRARNACFHQRSTGSRRTGCWSSTTSTASATARPSRPPRSGRGRVDPGPHPCAALPHPHRAGEAAADSRASRLCGGCSSLRCRLRLAQPAGPFRRGRRRSRRHLRSRRPRSAAAGRPRTVGDRRPVVAADGGPGRLVAPRRRLAMFFLGQLGKYIPGSVWSIGAQADRPAGTRSHPGDGRRRTALPRLQRRHRRPPRIAGLITGGLALARLGRVGRAVAVPGSLPAVVRRLGGGGRAAVTRPRGTAGVVGADADRLDRYALALVLLSPGPPWHDLAALGGAFTLAYAVGVVIVSSRRPASAPAKPCSCCCSAR